MRSINGYSSRYITLSPPDNNENLSPKDRLRNFLKMAGEEIVKMSIEEGFFPVHIEVDMSLSTPIVAWFIPCPVQNLMCPTDRGPASCHINYEDGEGYKGERFSANHTVVVRITSAHSKFVAHNKVGQAFFYFLPGNFAEVAVSGI